MSETQKKTPLRLLWLVVPLVAVLEIGAQWYLPTRTPSEEDWKAVAEQIEADKGKHDLVVIAPEWAVQGRVHLGHLIPLRDLGRFDTTRYDRLFEVSFRGSRAPEAAGLEPESEAVFGDLTLRRYDLPSKAEVVYDLFDELDRCRAEGMPPPRPRVLTDHWFGTRLAIPIRLRRRPVALTCDDVPLGTVLYGYGMVGRLDYRKHALPEGTPIELSFSVDGEQVGAVSIGNFDPLEPFAIDLPGEGRGTLRIELTAPDNEQRAFGFAADVRRPQQQERAP